MVAAALGVMVAAALGVMVAAALGGCGEALPHRPDLVLVTIDTLRADHLDLYGYERATAPELRALAAGGVTFERALAAAPWTLPSIASLHTSLLPSAHGADRADKAVAPGIPMLAEALRDAGYSTHAVVSHVFVSERYGFARGFASFDASHIADAEGISSGALTRAALAAYHDAPSDRPRFLWVHYFDPHFSYVGHREFGFAAERAGRFSDRVGFQQLGGLAGPAAGELSADEVQQSIDLYDEEIAFTDAWLGRLVRGLRSEGADRAIVFAVTADHGEYFGERGRFGHGRDVYGPLVDVPLVIAGDLPSAWHGRRVAVPVEIAALPATLLRLAGVRGHPFRGDDLLRWVERDAGEEAAPPVFLEGSYAWGEDERKRAVVHGPWKLIEHQDDGRIELYHLGRDAEERNDLSHAPETAERRAALRRTLAEHVAGGSAEGTPVTVGAGDREHLRALGYVEGP